MVTMPACHTRGAGSIPAKSFFFFLFLFENVHDKEEHFYYHFETLHAVKKENGNGMIKDLTSVYIYIYLFPIGPRQANLCLRAFRHDKF